MSRYWRGVQAQGPKATQGAGRWEGCVGGVVRKGGHRDVGPWFWTTMPDTCIPPASQTCSSWGASKELELEKCKEGLQGSDMEKIFGVSSRIAKVMIRKAVWVWPPGAWAISGGGARLLPMAFPGSSTALGPTQVMCVKVACDMYSPHRGARHTVGAPQTPAVFLCPYHVLP